MNDLWFGYQCSPGPSMGFGIPCGGGIVERDQTLFLWIFRDNCKTVGDY
jgi:hypothetical protein